ILIDEGTSQPRTTYSNSLPRFTRATFSVILVLEDVWAIATRAGTGSDARLNGFRSGAGSGACGPGRHSPNQDRSVSEPQGDGHSVPAHRRLRAAAYQFTAVSRGGRVGRQAA